MGSASAWPARYAPGLVTGQLIDALGPHASAAVGSAFFAGSVAVLRTGITAGHFVLGMSLCGLGWNLCFCAGSMLLDSCYTDAEATRVQGANDFIVFTFSAFGSLGSGYVFSVHGWQSDVLIMAWLAVCIIPLPVVGVWSAIRARQSRHSQKMVVSQQERDREHSSNSRNSALRLTS